MSQTKLLLCLLVIYSGPGWNPVRCVTVRTPPKNPATVEAQAKFFQDFFSVQLSPYKIEFGHVCEDPNTWEQRYEKKDYKNHRDMGKVRWGDKKGGYGEHYWDLNHAGHAGNHGDDGYDSSDDGSYHEEDGHDSYDESSDQSPNYRTNEYDPELAAKYEETNRAKRAHTKSKVKRKEMEEQQSQKPKKQPINNEQLETAASHSIDNSEEESEEERKDDKESYQKKSSQNFPRKPKQDPYKPEEYDQPREKNQIVLVVGHKDRETHEQSNQFAPQKLETKHYLPYEGGAGIRYHQQQEVSAAATAPRLFLEPYSGHVIDRNTGQAYVLQPIVQTSNYS